MLCRQCGYPNKRSSSVCAHCGATLAQNKPPRTKKARLIALLFIGLPVVLTAVIAVILLTGGVSIIGPWHNTEQNQLLRFHDDGTVVVRTAQGDAEAAYVYDKARSQGVISLSGAAMPFAVTKDGLKLTGMQGEVTFVRGDMSVVAAMAQAMPEPTPDATPSAAASATPAASATAASTPQPAATPKPSAAASASPQPSATPGPSLISALPELSLAPDIKPLTSSIEGDWYSPALKLTFYGGKTYSLSFGSLITETGTYTYNALTKTGEIISNGSSEHLTFSVSGDTLTFENDHEFTRQ